MARQYRTREGEATAIDTKSQLITVGSETAPGPLLVPQGVSNLVGVIVATESNYAAAESSGALIRLEGSGLPDGPEVLAAGAMGNDIATGARSAIAAHFIPLNTPVTPANEILLFGEMVGGDSGAVSFVVTLVFE